ncbi:hypothetical protein RND71_018389 [Anisodus tanguticus]|uniref:Uncharacterized protein n=1 Tax=Anisodus tanguticus TaxID=243964 RepID=A0AAE1S443_9SOLA|nr:hypothetical protein RND71_018389 [Anisodus tanguticus]
MEECLFLSTVLLHRLDIVKFLTLQMRLVYTKFIDTWKQGGDVVAVIEEIKEAEPEIDNKNLDMKDVEIESEQAVKVEVVGQSSAISESITSSEQIPISDGDTDNMTLGCSEATKQFIKELEREFSSGSYAGVKASKEING